MPRSDEFDWEPSGVEARAAAHGLTTLLNARVPLALASGKIGRAHV